MHKHDKDGCSLELKEKGLNPKWLNQLFVSFKKTHLRFNNEVEIRFENLYESLKGETRRSIKPHLQYSNRGSS